MAFTLAVPTIADLPAVYRIALLAREDGTRSPSDRPDDPDLIGHVYAGAYVVADPSVCRLLVLGSSVVGFCVATADTQGFERWCEGHWWPPLRERYPLPADSETGYDSRMIRLIHRPERTPDTITDQFPAHLHINLLPEAQGTGEGGRLIRAVHSALGERGVRGVHLGVRATNTRAIGFYEHLGYRLLGTEDDGTGRLYGLALS